MWGFVKEKSKIVEYIFGIREPTELCNSPQKKVMQTHKHPYNFFTDGVKYKNTLTLYKGPLIYRKYNK